MNKNYTSTSNENSNEGNESDENSYIDNTKVQLGNNNYKTSNTKSNTRTEKNGEKRRSKSSALFLKTNYMKKLDINNIEDNKFDNAPPKYFNVKLAKKIDTKQISSQNDNTLSNFKNIYSLKWLGKNFFRMTKKKDIDTADNIYYYCINHRTLKNSTEITSKGKPKRVSFCNARIIYVKNKGEFFNDWGHSTYCNKEKIEEYENKGDINEEIENYKGMKTSLLKYLNSHPMISCYDFIKKGYKVYNKNKCQFNIENYTFKNIYYTWRKNSMSFTKYSALENPLTNDNQNYLRDYTYTTLYNSSGKTQFIHEHMLFISNYFINKLSAAEHIYIDGTFLFPPGFTQLFVILYRDENTGIRYPGLYP